MDIENTAIGKSGNKLRWLAIVVLGALAFYIRWHYVIHAQVFQPVNEPNVRGDAVDYYQYAWNLAHHAIFSKDAIGTIAPISDSYRDPGYPLLMAGWMKVFDGWDDWYAAMLLSQAFLSALTVVLLLLVGSRSLSSRWLVFGGVLMAVWPHSVASTSFLLTETLVSFLCALSMWLVCRALERPVALRTGLSGLAMGAAALTNAILIPFGLLLAAALFLRKNISAKQACTLAAAAILLPFLWEVRAATLPAAASSSDRALINLVQGSWPPYHADYQRYVKGDPQGQRTMDAINNEYEALRKAPLSGLASIGKRLSEAPLHYLAWYISKPALLWGWDIRIGQGDIYIYPTGDSPFKNEAGYRALAALCKTITPLLMILMLVGCIVALLKRDTHARSVAVLALLAIYVTGIYGVLQSEPRYAIPFRGIEVLLATFALQWLCAQAFAKAARSDRSAPKDVSQITHRP